MSRPKVSSHGNLSNGHPNRFFSLAKAEMYIIIATVFSSFEFELYDTDISDVEMAHAYLVPYPKWESKGIRMRVKPAMSLAE